MIAEPMHTPTGLFTKVQGKAFTLPLPRFLHDLPRDYVGTLARINAAHGPLVHWRVLGAFNFAFISDGAVNRELFVRHHTALEKVPSRIQTFLYAAGPSVATAHGADWRIKRKEANSLFARPIIDAFCAGQIAVAARYLRSLGPARQDAGEVSRMLAALTSSRGILGREITAEEARAQIAFSAAAGARFNAEAAQFFARPNWMLAPWRHRLARRKAEAFAIVARALANLRQAEAPNDGLMAHYVNGDFATSSEAQMQTTLVGLLMGAQDNVAAAAGWLLAFVALHGDLQEELRREVRAAEQGAEGLASCALVRATVAEVLRLRPPAPASQPRRLTRAVSLAGHSLPRGTYVFNSFYNMHRDARVFQSPETFDPHRFVDGTRARAPSFAPFGHGPRHCVAQAMALGQLGAILFAILRDTRLTTPVQRLPPMEQRPFLTPAPFEVMFRGQ